jgi:hypothetical protein
VTADGDESHAPAPSDTSVILLMSATEDAAGRIAEANRWLAARRRRPLTALATPLEAPTYGGSVADLPVKEFLALLSALDWRHRNAVQLLLRESDVAWAVICLQTEGEAGC